MLDAIANPREIDQELVDAYLARRALDYLVGFTLSPVLWRKLPGSRSAGRVQSVALRLICEREAEIEAFKPREYWTIEADFTAPDGSHFTARLTHLDGKKLDKFDLADEAAARSRGRQARAPARRSRSPRSSASRSSATPPRPSPPRPCSRKPRASSASAPASTMRIAQRLYEGVDIDGETVGLITYMRTDGVTLSQEAIEASRKLIAEQYGADYLPDAPRIYKTTAKNAQEAHEAIRPTDLFRRPDRIAPLSCATTSAALYELIWKRTVASQMESAELDQVAVDIATADGKAVLRATGSVVKFDGFLKLYQEDRDDPAEDDDENEPPPARRSRRATSSKPARSKPEQHFTQPPPRYTEASLVKKLEELGIGRPSTYASILQMLQDRDYVRLEKRRFDPGGSRPRWSPPSSPASSSATSQYGFTAELGGEARRHLRRPSSTGRTCCATSGRTSAACISRRTTRTVPCRRWTTRSASSITASASARRHRRAERDAGAALLPDRGDGTRPAPLPGLQARASSASSSAKNGAFIGCTNYPECRYTRPLAVADRRGRRAPVGPLELGADPKTGKTGHAAQGPLRPLRAARTKARTTRSRSASRCRTA